MWPRRPSAVRGAPAVGVAFAGDRRGGIALTFSLILPVLLGLVGGGLDYARLVASRSQLQAAVDAGALAGGNALKLAASSVASVKGVTSQIVRTNLPASADQTVAVTVEVATDRTSVFARAEEKVSLVFGRFLGMGVQTVSAQAKVSLVGKMRLCMLTLDPGAPGAFNLQKNAQVTASNCSLYSNSTDQQGMVGGDNSMARADTICSAGGYLGLRANFAPAPQTGCPVIGDPLKGRPTPAVGTCPNSFVANLLTPLAGGTHISANATLEPGTYCGGLYVSGQAHVTLKPGIYVIKNGPLIVTNSASFNGTAVGLYFTGNNSGLLFNQGTTIGLTAPTSGVMAGLLMMDDRDAGTILDPAALLNALMPSSQVSPTPSALGATQPMRIYRIISDNARTMLGTIYLPSGRVVIDASRPVADQSAYTVVVARQVNLYEGPNLYLNANYDSTSVPVPQGVGPLSGRVVITQ
ncbi:pilus assembly protein TadG-related protein [Methylobacterium sp. J-076]|uniref:pilus assembly protein TadG-related protein n=1 Tax=Methylobacterium sp. J-076 TaxID=2836655 RepID=UPI001FBBF2D7|nr:pilus assembly protein TadG-related protein [Methylobacterium sp. J-076]MCJ2012237.1 pilus assembly protein TadG-related protein [Methylobacterium sp. J-076]